MCLTPSDPACRLALAGLRVIDHAANSASSALLQADACRVFAPHNVSPLETVSSAWTLSVRGFSPTRGGGAAPFLDRALEARTRLDVDHESNVTAGMNGGREAVGNASSCVPPG